MDNDIHELITKLKRSVEMSERTSVKFNAKMVANIEATRKHYEAQMSKELTLYARAAMDGMDLEGTYKIDLAKYEFMPVEDKSNVTNT